MLITERMTVNRQAVQDKSSALAELLDQIAGGDSRAFERLFRMTAPKLVSYARRLTGDCAAAEEISQEAMLAIWSNAHRYDPALSAPLTWMRTIVRNQAWDLHRRQMVRLPGAPDAGDAVDPQCLAPGPCGSLERAQENASLSLWLCSLAAENQRAIELTWLGELSHSEAALVMNKPLGTLKTLVRRGLAQLRRRAGSAQGPGCVAAAPRARSGFISLSQ